MESTKKIRKKRETPNKKWTYDETCKLLDYLQQSEEIEAPTAQIFYKKLLEQVPINATWELVRHKVRHLKASFKKAEDWRKSTGSGIEEGDGSASVEAKLNQMCPHYSKLKDIFGAKTYELCVDVIDSGEPYIVHEIEQSEEFLDLPDIIEYDLAAHSTSVNNTETQVFPCSDAPISSSPVTQKASEFAKKLKRQAPKSSICQLLQFQEERKNVLQMKLEWEKQKHEKEMEIAEKKLKLEEEKIKAETEVNILRIDKEEKLAILAMEKEERLATLELQLKYNSKK